MKGWPYGKIGLVLATEEHSVKQLLRTAEAAEKAGFGFLFVSDHFHPWNLHQGHSSNVWPVLGALAVRTRKLGLVSAVTCPILRSHPTTIAQSASTVFHLSEGRFVLGLGTGEYLNEHIVGAGWPPFKERLERLNEFVTAVRALLTGEQVDFNGSFFQVDSAQLYDAAERLPIYYAASGQKTAKSARKHADGLICLGPRRELIDAFASDGKPKTAQISVCWGENRADAVATAHRIFPEVAMPGDTFTRLKTPADFTRAACEVSPEDVACSIVCGPEPRDYLEAVEECFQAGFDGVALHQIGPDQDGFLKFWQTEIKPILSTVRKSPQD